MEEKQTIEARLCETAEELQIIFEALVYAEENRGDTSEYRMMSRDTMLWGLNQPRWLPI